jgi:hypothetical protein
MRQFQACVSDAVSFSLALFGNQIPAASEVSEQIPLKGEAFPKLRFLGMAHEPVDKNPFMIGGRVEPAYESVVRDRAAAGRGFRPLRSMEFPAGGDNNRGFAGPAGGFSRLARGRNPQPAAVIAIKIL